MKQLRARSIVFCVDSPGFGGAERTAMRVIEWIRSPALRVIHTEKLCAQVRAFLMTKQITADEFFASGNRAWDAPGGIWRAIRIIARHPKGLFVIWAHHSDSNRWLQFMLALLRRDFILVERLVPSQAGDLAPSRLTIPLKRFVVPRAYAVVLNAYSQVEHYQHLFRIGEEHIIVISNSRPVNEINELVCRMRLNKAGLRKKLGLQDRPTVACVGRLTKQKGQDTLIRAMGALACDAQLVFVGDGPDETELRRLAADAPGIVVFAGYQPDPLPWLAVADAFVLPSSTEGLPGALIEAMAAELPCIASDIPGNRELVKDKQTGLLVSPQSSTDLARALEKLLMNKSAAHQYAKAGFLLVKDRYDEATELAAWKNLFGID